MVLLSRQNMRLCLLVISVLTLLAVSVSATEEEAEDPLMTLASLHNNLGVVQALNDDFDGAGIHFDSAAMLMGENAALCNNLGNSNLCRGQLTEALQYYEKASALDSLERRVLFNWSLALYLSGDADEAVAMMERFLEYYGQEEDSSEAISWLQREGFMKGKTQVTTTAEVKRLMDKAKARLKQALDRKMVSGVNTAEDTLAAGTEKKTEQQKRTKPAGGKAVESASVTSLLYWIVM